MAGRIQAGMKKKLIRFPRRLRPEKYMPNVSKTGLISDLRHDGDRLDTGAGGSVHGDRVVCGVRPDPEKGRVACWDLTADKKTQFVPLTSVIYRSFLKKQAIKSKR